MTIMESKYTQVTDLNTVIHSLPIQIKSHSVRSDWDIFERFLATNFLTKAAKLFGKCWNFLVKYHFLQLLYKIGLHVIPTSGHTDPIVITDAEIFF